MFFFFFFFCLQAAHPILWTAQFQFSCSSIPNAWIRHTDSEWVPANPDETWVVEKMIVAPIIGRLCLVVLVFLPLGCTILVLYLIVVHYKFDMALFLFRDVFGSEALSCKIRMTLLL